MGVHNLSPRRQLSERRRGVTMFYIVAVLVAMMGFVSFAVDLGRVQTAKTELRRAADAAARAGVACLSQGTSAVQTAAINMAGNEKCDGSSVSVSTSNVVVGIWNTSTKSFSASGSADNVTKFQAVQVTASRTKSGGNAIPLLFGMVVGAKTCDVTATSVAALMAQTTSTQWVSAHGNPWLAGEPSGTLGSEPDTGYGYTSQTSNHTHPWEYDIANPGKIDTSSTTYTDSSKVESTDYSTGQPYGSPSKFVLNVTPGSIIQVSVPTDSNNVAKNDGFLTGGSGTYYADGTGGSGSIWSLSDDAANPSLPQGTATTAGNENGISNIIAPINSMVGVFLDQTSSSSGADSETPPSGLDFSTQTARDYSTLEPKLNQSFYVGTGSDSSGNQQTVVVPSNAYALFLGTMDGHEWSNNVGGFNATITQYTIEIVH
jgi:Flp pilus assembly protein TadG